MCGRIHQRPARLPIGSGVLFSVPRQKRKEPIATFASLNSSVLDWAISENSDKVEAPPINPFGREVVN